MREVWENGVKEGDEKEGRGGGWVLEEGVRLWSERKRMYKREWV